MLISYDFFIFYLPTSHPPYKSFRYPNCHCMVPTLLRSRLTPPPPTGQTSALAPCVCWCNYPSGMPVPSSPPLFPTLHLLHLRDKALFSACSSTIFQARNQVGLPGFFLPLTFLISFSCEGLKLRFLLGQVCYGFALSPRVWLLGGGPYS